MPIPPPYTRRPPVAGIRKPAPGPGLDRDALERDIRAPQPLQPDQPAAAQKSAYDIRREQAQAEGAQEDERQREALQRSLAGAGISDSGIQLAQERTQDVQNRLATGRRMTEIDVQQLLSEEENKRELQRQGYMTSERTGREAFERELEGGRMGLSKEQLALQRELGVGNLGLQKEQLSQQGRQFERGLQSSETQAQLGREHQVGLANLQNTLAKDFGTFQDMINDANKTADDNTKRQMLYLGEQIAALDPKAPGFQAQLLNIMRGGGVVSQVAAPAGTPPTGQIGGSPGAAQPTGDRALGNGFYQNKQGAVYKYVKNPDGSWSKVYQDGRREPSGPPPGQA